MGALDDLLAETEQQPSGQVGMRALDALEAETQKPFGWKDTWPVRLGKGLYEEAKSLATLPGDVYAGRVDPEEQITRSARGALLMSPSPAGKLKWAAAMPKAPSEEALMGAGKAVYDAAQASPVTLRGDVVSKWAKYRLGDLQRKGFRDTQNNAPNTLGILKDLEAGGAQGGAGLSAGDYINLRQALQMHAQDAAGGTDATAASLVIKELDRLFDKAPPQSFMAGTPAEIGTLRKSLKDARDNFSAAYRSKLISKKDYNAQLQAEAANSGRNYDNALRQKLVTVLRQPDKGKSLAERSGYSPSEIAAAEKIVEGTTPRNLLRDVGNRLGGGGGLGATAAGAAGGYFVGGDLASTLMAGAGVQGVGLGMKAAQNLLARGAANKFTNQLRLRSPKGQEASAIQARPPLGDVPYTAEEAYKLLLLYQLQNPDRL